MHQLQAFDPARNHTANRQVDRTAALDRAIENGAIGQAAFVVNGHYVVLSRLTPLGRLDDFVLQAGFGGLHTLTLGILFEKLLAGLDRLGVHLGHTLFGARLQEREGFHQLLIGELLLLVADGVFDTLRYSLGIEIIHALLRKALAHVQADTVGRLLRRSVQFDTGLRIAAGKYQADQRNRRCQTLMSQSHAVSLITLEAYR